MFYLHMRDRRTWVQESYNICNWWLYLHHNFSYKHCMLNIYPMLRGSDTRWSRIVSLGLVLLYGQREKLQKFAKCLNYKIVEC